MKFTLSIKPSTYDLRKSSYFRSNSINSAGRFVSSNYRGAYFSYSTLYHGYSDKEYVYAYNTQKVRTKRSRITKGKNKGKYVVTKEGKTLVNVYKIPIELLRLAKLKVIQNQNSFEIRSSK